MRRLSNSPAQGAISGFAALSLLILLSWVRGRNCATTLVLFIKTSDLELLTVMSTEVDWLEFGMTE
jgi:hypothetical protein